MTTKRDRIDTLMKNHLWLEVRYYPKGTYGGYQSAAREFRSPTKPYRTRASFTSPDRTLAHAKQLMVALPQENDGVPF